MNDASANPPVGPAAAPPAGENWTAGPRPDEAWSRKQILFLILLALAGNIAFIYTFGTRKPFIAKPVTDVPRLQLARPADETMELDNPALFALPNPRDFAAAIWQQAPAIKPPSFRWQAAPGELTQPDAASLGATFSQFMRTNWFGNFQLNFKPAPVLSELTEEFPSALPAASTLRINGVLARRPLLAQPTLPSFEWPDVIAPSKVQVTVDKIGNVISAVVLPTENVLEAAGRSPKGDTNAVVLARSLKFAPAPQVVSGEVTFFWHTTPPATNDLPTTNPP